ncbi:acyl-CoA carboxylase subunit epsilon [Streptomyces formicae]|uniref:acyl-CoA carboxylase subunit epsilon n=1 Tax=Streptomyces formicae TaxID=1616117 RepID=UPI001F56E5D1|nr:acyl-CoA carboxylase subunit epsilon [Streptomyces formicae]
MNCDIRIVHGDPDEDELAALMAVLGALASTRRSGPGAAEPRARERRAHWDRAWGGGFAPCGSWRERDRSVAAFDPGSR